MRGAKAAIATTPRVIILRASSGLVGVPVSDRQSRVVERGPSLGVFTTKPRCIIQRMLTWISRAFRHRVVDDPESSVLRVQLAELRALCESFPRAVASFVEVSENGSDSPAEPLFTQITHAGEAAEWIGEAIETFASMMRRRLPRG
jgi:hypothetical protein